MKAIPTYNVFLANKVVFTGTRFDCETYITENKLLTTLVREPTFAIFTCKQANFVTV